MQCVLVFAVLLVLAGTLTNAVKCPKDRFDCSSARATCVNNRCQCGSPYVGLGPFGCFDKGKMCAVFNDPNIQTFAGEPKEPVKFAFPCKFPMTEYHTQYEEGGKGYSCSFSVFGAMKTFGGRMFVHGYELEVNTKITDLSDGSLINAAYNNFRVTGTCKAGVYNYVFESSENSLPYREASDVSASQAQALPGAAYYEISASRRKFDIPTCLTEVIFRPVNEDVPFGSSSNMPGLVLINTRDSATQFPSPQDGVCLTTRKDDYDVARNMADTRASDPIGAFNLRALRYPAAQDFPDTPKSACRYLATDVASMSDDQKLSAAEKSCRFVLEEEHFVNCFDKERDATMLLSFYGSCLKSFYGMGITCDSLMADIAARGCEDKVPSTFTCPSSSSPDNEFMPVDLNVAPEPE